MCTFPHVATDAPRYARLSHVLAHIPLHFSKNVNTLTLN